MSVYTIPFPKKANAAYNGYEATSIVELVDIDRSGLKANTSTCLDVLPGDLIVLQVADPATCPKKYMFKAVKLSSALFK